nr:GGDEF domain-containing phosphodiesterase [Kineococcus aurantiacus]
MLCFGARRGRQLREEHRQRRRAEDAAAHLARTDHVTGLPNRAAFADAVHTACATAGRTTVVLFDLRGFAQVNEAFGHGVGDAVLTSIGQQLHRACRRDPWHRPGHGSPDTPASPATPDTGSPARSAVARVGDDRFGVLWVHPAPGTALAAGLVDGEGTVSTSPVVARWVEDVLQDLQQPREVAGVQLEVVAQAGLAGHAGRDGQDGGDSGAVDLLRRADAALTAGRREGVPVRCFDAALAQRSARQLLLHGQLRHALQRGEVTVHYQPQVDCSSGRVVALEALVRWQHPHLGLLLPGAFLDVAERSSLITPLTETVIGLVAADVAGWCAAGRDLVVAVNLSARVLDAHLLDVLEGHLARHGVPARALELEVTETAALADERTSSALLRELRRRGHPVAIDDFGTGHAGLTYLRTVPASTLKIDRAFITGLDADPRKQAVAHQVSALAHRLGMDVVAEGVETARDWAAVRAAGCDRAQGYWLGRPVPAADLPTVLAAAEARTRTHTPAG